MAKQDPNAEKDYTPYATAKPTPLQVDFTAWIQSKTGYDPAAAKSKAEAFAEGVRLGVALRIPFQASDENKTATAERKAARAAQAAATPAPAAETAPAKPAKATKATAAKATPEAAPPAAESAPPAGRRRGARKATAASADAAF